MRQNGKTECHANTWASTTACNILIFLTVKFLQYSPVFDVV